MATNKTTDHDGHFAEFMAELDEMESEPSVQVGFFPGNNPSGGDGTSIATYMFYNEMGTETIPPRPLISTTHDENKDHMIELEKELFAEIATLRNDVRGALHEMGIEFRGILKKAQTKWDQPPNAEVTQWIKGNYKKKVDNPLIDTGTARNAITHKVIY